MLETWLPVVGYEGFYEVSDHGRVRSLDRVTISSTGRRRQFYGQVLAPARQTSGYWYVHLCAQGCKKVRLVHHLMLEAFVGPRPERQHGCHRDDDQNRNVMDNLEWGTAKKNAEDKVRNGRHHYARRTECTKGHPLSGENLISRSDGGRRCRVCTNARSKAAKAERRAA